VFAQTKNPGTPAPGFNFAVTSYRETAIEMLSVQKFAFSIERAPVAFDAFIRTAELR
jgi:hypothetical protein